MDPESFFEDTKCLLEDKKLGTLFKKDLQAEETEEVDFFLFSNCYRNRKDQIKSITKSIQDEFQFTPIFNLRLENTFDPTNKIKKFSADTSKPKQEIKATCVEVIKGDETKIVQAVGRLFSLSKSNYPDSEKMHFISSPKYTQNSGLKEKYSNIINRQD